MGRREAVPLPIEKMPALLLIPGAFMSLEEEKKP